MKLRFLLTALALCAPALQAQDTSAVKGLAQRDSVDAVTIQSAAGRIIARTDSIYKALRKKDTAITPIPPQPTTGFDAVAELPRFEFKRVTVSCTRQVNIGASANLQSAFDNAVAGDCLNLPAGSTYIGNFNLPNKGVTQAWIIVRTLNAALPPPGTRMTPALSASLKLAKIQSPNYQEAIGSSPGANHWLFTGLDIGTTPAVQSTGMNALIRLTDVSSPMTVAGIPSYFSFQQNYIHATPTLDIRRLVRADARYVGAFDNWMSDAHSNNSDSQCWLILTAGKFQTLENNYCSAGHELIMSGGGGEQDSTYQPSDFTVRRNHFIRPAEWKGVWQAKNLIETKNLRRLLFEGNVMENSWQDAQAGFCWVLKSENQEGAAPWTTSSDFTIRYNIARRCASGFNISARGSNGTPGIPASRYSIHDNVLDSIGKFGGDGIAIQSLGDVVDIQYRNNSILNGLQSFYSNQTISFDGPSGVRSLWDKNAWGHGQYGVKGGGTSDGMETLNTYAVGSTFTNNAFVGGCGPYPATNTCVTSVSQVTVGADTAKVRSMTLGVVVPSGLGIHLAAPRANQLKYRVPKTDPKCRTAATKPLEAAKCDVPLLP